MAGTLHGPNGTMVTEKDTTTLGGSDHYKREHDAKSTVSTDELLLGGGKNTFLNDKNVTAGCERPHFERTCHFASWQNCASDDLCKCCFENGCWCFLCNSESISCMHVLVQTSCSGSEMQHPSIIFPHTYGAGG